MAQFLRSPGPVLFAQHEFVSKTPSPEPRPCHHTIEEQGPVAGAVQPWQTRK